MPLPGVLERPRPCLWPPHEWAWRWEGDPPVPAPSSSLDGERKVPAVCLKCGAEWDMPAEDWYAKDRRF